METVAEFHLASHLSLLKSLLSADSRTTVEKRLKANKFPYQYLSSDELKALLEKTEDVIQSRPGITKDNFLKLLKSNSSRFDATAHDGIESTIEYKSIRSFINSVCAGNVIETAKANLMNE